MKRTFLLALAVAVAACGGAQTSPRTPAGNVGGGVAPPAAPAFATDAGNRMLHDAWTKAGVVPSPRADDATFLRRVYIDLAGTLPPPEEIERFLADASEGKRAKVVETLLASPAYAEHWMNYWDDVLMGREVKGKDVDRGAFRAWLRAELAKNTPWDKLVYDLMTATGQNSQGGDRMKVAMGMPVADPEPEGEKDAGAAVNGAVNWTLRHVDAPADLAGNASRIFLGVQIQCAQCHDHKTEKWKQTDFQKFSAATLHLSVEAIDKGKTAGIRRVSLVDAPRVFPRIGKTPDLAPIAKSQATALDGTSLEKAQDTRKALASWMVQAKNPWFAKAFVNRMWGHFMGRGFIDPVDDVRPSNPAVVPELLDALAEDFAAHGFDVKRLFRNITALEPYHLSASASAHTDPDNHLWGNFRLVPLGPEEMLNSVFAATSLDGAAKRAGLPNLPQLRYQLVRSFTFLFDVDEEFDTRDYEGSISQALTLLNGSLTNLGSRALPGTALEGILAEKKSDAEVVAAIYLRTVGRKPTKDEVERWTQYVQHASTDPPATTGAGEARKKKGKGEKSALARLAAKNPATTDPKRAAWEDLYWALLNSSEFIFNH